MVLQLSIQQFNWLEAALAPKQNCIFCLKIQLFSLTQQASKISNKNCHRNLLSPEHTPETDSSTRATLSYRLTKIQTNGQSISHTASLMGRPLKINWPMPNGETTVYPVYPCYPMSSRNSYGELNIPLALNNFQ